MIYLKYIWLIIVAFVRKTLRNFPIMVSYFLLLISAVICISILFTDYFDRVPLLSYFISQSELPQKYILEGEVKVYDRNGDIVNSNIDVFVGGYSAYQASDTFTITFASPPTNELYVVIRYQIDKSIHESTFCLNTKDENHIIRKEFVIYA